MENKLHHFLPHFLFHFLPFLLLTFPPCMAQDQVITSTDPSYYYNLCSTSKCNTTHLAYPFGLPRFCHHPSMTTACTADGRYLLSTQQQTGAFRVLSGLAVDAAGATPIVAADSLFGCGQVSAPDYTYGVTIFSLPNNYTFGTHLNCTRRPSSAGAGGLQPAACLACRDEGNVCFYSPGFVSFPECEVFYVFLPQGFNVTAEKDLRGYLRKGFPLRYSKDVECQSCGASGGLCGASPNGTFVCFCSDSVHQSNCTDGMVQDLKAWVTEQQGKSKSSKTLAIALSTSASAVVLCALAAVACIYAVKRKRDALRDNESQSQTESKIIAQMGVEDLVDGITPTRFSYSEIKKFTNNFESKLGEGGSGNIYKGVAKKNRHETPIAVKVLKVSKQSEKQFMNEVSTIGRIHHHNLVGLMGYCVQGKKRALVYEFMENGSLDKYIYDDSKKNTLSPEQMHAIALDTARGILYLHEGCRSRILHCDIKPHNVLLDSNFSAKVADFGLARMADKDWSHVSLTVARGTPGYAAPEMWSKSYGPVTDKSDVYSYGMLLLEMAGGRKKYELDADTPSQVYFPEWVFEHVKNSTKRGFDETVGDQLEGKDGDGEIVERMCLVGLWCIQHMPANRPSMTEVIQMLEGKVEIGTPPHPFPVDGGVIEVQSKEETTSTVYLSAMSEGV